MSKQLHRWMVAVFGALVALLLVTCTGTAGADESGHETSTAEPMVTTAADWQEVAKALGRPGVLSDDGLVYRVTFPRNELTVTSYGVTIKPALGLFSYAAFSRYPDGNVVMMGDLLTTEPEQPAATDVLRAGDLEQTAVHKHLLEHDPDLWWNHFHGSGPDEVAMATTVRMALNHTSTPPATPCSSTEELNLDTAAIDTALGTKGTVDCGIYRFIFQRNETITSHHRVLAPAIGVTTAISFQPTGGGKAAISGDFAMTGYEVQGVIRALRTADIQVVELHQHSLDDQPRLFYMHFWGQDKATTLAKALSAAVKAHNVSPLG